ncbi:MAG: UvrD-helicase domain-containing protein [Kiritimatiellae bacterium]|nr:UvrD-helicase domain-containing protein [Kiritimatiellia bacterium]
MNGNKIIEASAGTGKTHRLASRIIALLRAGAKPQEIVALTFSRAAAGEIFVRFVGMLAKSARRRPADIALLRQAIGTQHLSQIGTLDSFLMRMARVFPLELGICGEMQIMDESRAEDERAKTSFSILRRTDETSRRHFAEAFSLAMNREEPRSFIAAYNKFVGEWHGLVLENGDEAAWNCVRGVFGDSPPEWIGATEADLARAADGLLDIFPGDAAWAAFAEWVKGFRGRLSGLVGIAGKVMSLAEEDLSRAVIEFKYRKRYAVAGEDARKLRDAVHLVAGYCMRMKIEETMGVYRLISAFEREYNAKVRAKGNLVFGDIPRLVSSLPEHVRRNLEYRMDCRIRAWALDEFQDTSRPQWRALADLVDEAKQSGGEKPVFVVGDFKQAIYGWREGDVSIFERECDNEAVYRRIHLDRTWRSGPAVVEAVNRVFNGGAIGDLFPRWKAKCHEHRSARGDIEGLVQVMDAPGAKKEDFLEPVYNALAAARPVERGLEAAVLVRDNKLGRKIVNYLKGRGMNDVEFEGDGDSCETTALGGFLDLVELADHPGATMTWRHFMLTNVAKAAYGDRLPQPDEVSRDFSRAFTEKGLVRTFRELREAIRASMLPDWGEYVESQYVGMLKAAEEFELSMRPDTRLSDFRPFLQSRRSRTCAAAGKVRVMTIHRSKGLGFDYVVLPLHEKYGIGGGGEKGPVVGDGWVLGDPGAAGKYAGALSRAMDERKCRKELEELCTYYVAMTRAKKSMTVILHPQAARDSSTVRFSDIVRQSLGSPAEIGNRRWAEALAGTNAPASGSGCELPVPRTEPRKARQSFRRRLPSRKFADGEVASALFMRDSARRRAIERGVEAHREFEALDFVDGKLARDDFDRALVRPAGFTDLWRERSYEILSGGVWESGQFDRVVFAGGRAVIQDFKTNRPMRGESREEFEARMAMTYRAQMTAYRRALERLTGIPAEAISCELLLVATRSRAVVGDMQGAGAL